MHGERRHVVARRQPQQHAAQQEIARQVERPAGLVSHQGEDRRLARALRQARQIDQRQGERRRLLDHLHRRPLPRGEDRAQRLVAARGFAEAARQHLARQRPGDAQRDRDVVERAARFELIDEPQALLGERQGQRPQAGDLADGDDERDGRDGRRGRRRAAGAHRLDPAREVCQPRGGEQVAQRHLDAEGAAQPRHHPGGQQGVSPQGEEVVGGADSFAAEQLRPDAGQHLLDRRPRRHVAGCTRAFPVRRR